MLRLISHRLLTPMSLSTRYMVKRLGSSTVDDAFRRREDNRNVYLQQRPELAKKHCGEWVVVFNRKILGIYPSVTEANAAVTVLQASIEDKDDIQETYLTCVGREEYKPPVLSRSPAHPSSGDRPSASSPAYTANKHAYFYTHRDRLLKDGKFAHWVVMFGGEPVAITQSQGEAYSRAQALVSKGLAEQKDLDDVFIECLGREYIDYGPGDISAPRTALLLAETEIPPPPHVSIKKPAPLHLYHGERRRPYLWLPVSRRGTGVSRWVLAFVDTGAAQTFLRSEVLQQFGFNMPGSILPKDGWWLDFGGVTTRVSESDSGPEVLRQVNLVGMDVITQGDLFLSKDVMTWTPRPVSEFEEESANKGQPG